MTETVCFVLCVYNSFVLCRTDIFYYSYWWWWGIVPNTSSSYFMYHYCCTYNSIPHQNNRFPPPPPPHHGRRRHNFHYNHSNHHNHPLHRGSQGWGRPFSLRRPQELPPLWEKIFDHRCAKVPRGFGSQRVGPSALLLLPPLVRHQN